MDARLWRSFLRAKRFLVLFGFMAALGVPMADDPQGEKRSGQGAGQNPATRGLDKRERERENRTSLCAWAAKDERRKSHENQDNTEKLATFLRLSPLDGGRRCPLGGRPQPGSWGTRRWLRLRAKAENWHVAANWRWSAYTQFEMRANLEWWPSLFLQSRKQLFSLGRRG